jgi:hypothetical protein
MRKLVWLALGSSLALGSQSAPPQVATSPAKYTFAYAPKKGDVTAYKMSMSMDMGLGTPMDIGVKVTTTVTKAEGGMFTVVTTMSDPEGVPASVDLTKIKSTQVVDSHGKVVKTTTEGMPEGAGSFSQSNATEGLPDHPVAVGDTWTAEIKSPLGPETGTYKLAKVEEVKGVQQATIQLTDLTAAPNSKFKVKLTEPGTEVVEVNSGLVHSESLGSTVTVLANEQTPEVTITVHMTMKKL